MIEAGVLVLVAWALVFALVVLVVVAWRDNKW